ncbi:MFS transporter [Rhizobium sp. No.120]
MEKQSADQTQIRRGTIPVMAVACGVMVGNIYLCQPLLGAIAKDFGVPESIASLVAVMTQVGYALGILLLVPLSDMAEPRSLVRWMSALAAVGLLMACLAPAIPVLLAASIFLAFVTVVPQVLIPLATSLVAPEHRGRAVGSLATGLIMGILLSRTISGLVAGYGGSWRASYGLASVLSVVVFFLVPAFMPKKSEHATSIGYFKLLASLPPLLKHRDLILSMAMNFLVFGAFSAFWATMAFHLATPEFGLGPAAAGLFGLWGAPGALLAPIAGRLSDRWGPARVNVLGFASVLICFAIAITIGAHSLIALVVVVNLLDFGLQSGQVANQTRIFAIAPEIRGRLNTLYMVSTFGGGAIGALAGGYAWSAAGWTGVCLLGFVATCLAAIILATGVATATSSKQGHRRWHERGRAR